jgi:O-antigen/teichoic acid export membrane protein
LPEVLRGFHEIKIYSLFRNVSQNAFVLFAILISIYYSALLDPIYILYGSIVISTGLLFIVVYKFLKKHHINFSITGKYDKTILKYSYPMFLTSSMIFLMGYLDSFMISYYLGEYEVGIYSACVKLSFAVTFVLASVNGFIAPKISQAYSRSDFNEVKKIYYNSIKIIVFVSAPIFLLLYIFPEFFLGLFGDEFKTVTTTLFIINTAFLVNALCGSVGYLLNMTDNQHMFMKILLGGLGINISFNILLIPLYGINGAAIATLISMSFWNINSLLILKRKKII